ncbi:DNA repair exonuclease [Iocasia frigidifontis]|uniref:DNA repair exonuclease n=1 Tax=Iocasia fonsfrigidae TaxID=2682810 RepID=A0A8A7KFE4_9FIRM|nr:DNA repair exonuclease [Iocasia fonsfrigidae]QTL97617.1 DNA repair exonuclease [Iocasia fonsfrigidae]
MGLKILHTADLHLGMKFSNYPAYIREDLIEARFNTLENLVSTANQEECNLFVIAGDLFDKLNIPLRDIKRVIGILNNFAGDCVLVMPGNHDYDNGMVELWQCFQDNISDRLILLNKAKPYKLTHFDLDLTVYPAYCDRKHSAANKLDWIKDYYQGLDDGGKCPGTYQLGIAHGALNGLSPDMSDRYFNMSEEELLELPVDLWLLGHTHIPYPANRELNNRRIFNAGTAEPDGLDCSHNGTAWLIEISREQEGSTEVSATLLETGFYRFKDLSYTIEVRADLLRIKEELLSDNPEQSLLRLKLSGRVDEDLYNNKEAVYQELRDRLAYLEIDDSSLKLRITEEVIDREFSRSSFPYLVLKELAASKEDEDALQLAYELIKEVRE